MLQSPEYYKQLKLKDDIIEGVLDTIFTSMIKMNRYEFEFDSCGLVAVPKDIINTIQSEKFDYFKKNVEKIVWILRDKGFELSEEVVEKYYAPNPFANPYPYSNERIRIKYTVKL